MTKIVPPTGTKHVYETKTAQLKLTWWPSPQDYNEAIQTPRANLQDVELCRSEVYSDVLGLPRPVTGSFACVYRMHCPEKDFALRLFLRNISDQAERYALVSDFVKHHNSPYTVMFHFLKSGIKIKGEWLSALKMEWVEGKQFDDYIVENLGDANKLGVLANNFLTMMNELRGAGIAHGDLQHGNIIMSGDELRLVDYDGMFVPDMHGFEANELGHRNYQHPERAARHFGPYLDNFSAWIIYASVRALQIDSRLMNQLGGGDDCLLFRQTDFVDPIHSVAFSALEQHESAEINALARFVRAQLKNDLALIPALQIPVPAVTVALEPLSSTVEHLPLAPVEYDFEGGCGNEAPQMVRQSRTVPKRPAAAQWIKPTSTPLPVAKASAISTISAPTLQLSGTIPPELLIPRPRAVAFNEASAGIRPEYWQKLMILCPFLWILVYSSYMAFGPDLALRTNGVYYPATVTSVDRSESGWVKTLIWLEYSVNGVTYTANRVMGNDYGQYLTGARDRYGAQYKIRALPTNPADHETFDAPLGGEKQGGDIWIGILCLLVNLLLEAAIWIPVIRYRDLAELGVGVLARVDKLRIDQGSLGQRYHTAVVSFLPPGNTRPRAREIRMSPSDYQKLVTGSTEVMLCNENNPSELVFYRFCCYRPVSLSVSGAPPQSVP